MAAFAIAHAVLTPSVWAVLGAVAMADGVELQVRRVEEPYLERVHGAAYGRFIPRSVEPGAVAWFALTPTVG